MKKPLVIGIGNPLREDDRIGIEVARSLGENLQSLVDVAYCYGDTTELLDQWKDRACVFLIDAMQSDLHEEGVVHRFYPLREEIPAVFTQTSTHLFDTGAVIELARALDELPKDLVLYGIEARNFSLGQEVSPKIKELLTTIVNTIEEEIHARVKSV